MISLRAEAGKKTAASRVRPEDVDVANIVQHIKERCLELRIRLREFLATHDPLRKGHITGNQLSTALAAIQVTLQPEEEVAMARAYEQPGVMDNGGQPCLQWRRLARDVDAVFGPSHLERDPLLNPGTATGVARGSTRVADGTFTGLLKTGHGAASSQQAPMKPFGLTSTAKSHLGSATSRFTSLEEADALISLLQRLSFEQKNRHLALKPAFADSDKHRHGVLTAAQFSRQLKIAGIETDEVETELLTRAFRMPAQDRVDVNYLVRRYATNSPPPPSLPLLAPYRSMSIACAAR